MLQRLRDRLHIEELAGQRGGVRAAVRGQVPQELRAVRGAVPGAECADGAAGRYGHGQMSMLAFVMYRA